MKEGGKKVEIGTKLKTCIGDIRIYKDQWSSYWKFNGTSWQFPSI